MNRPRFQPTLSRRRPSTLLNASTLRCSTYVAAALLVFFVILFWSTSKAEPLIEIPVADGGPTRNREPLSMKSSYTVRSDPSNWSTSKAEPLIEIPVANNGPTRNREPLSMESSYTARSDSPIEIQEKPTEAPVSFAAEEEKLEDSSIELQKKHIEASAAKHKSIEIQKKPIEAPVSVAAEEEKLEDSSIEIQEKPTEALLSVAAEKDKLEDSITLKFSEQESIFKIAAKEELSDPYLGTPSKGEPPVRAPEVILESLFQMQNLRLSEPQLNSMRRKTRRKVVDCVLFNTEFDLLELRLRTLWDVVDWFVVVESSFTFQNKIKPLLFAQQRHRFARFESKIAYYAVNVPVRNHEYWETEVLHRNALGQGGIRQTLMAEKKVAFEDEDLIFVFDLDEIPRPEIVNWLAWNRGYFLPIQMWFSWRLYGFMWENPFQWRTSCVVSFAMLRDRCVETDERSILSGISNFATNNVRLKEGCDVRPGWILSRQQRAFDGRSHDLRYFAGWHCSWCMPLSLFVNKIESFAHTERNLAEFKNMDTIKRAKKEGKWFMDMNDLGNVISRVDFERNPVFFAPDRFQTQWDMKGMRYMLDPLATGDEVEGGGE